MCMDLTWLQSLKISERICLGKIVNLKMKENIRYTFTLIALMFDVYDVHLKTT